MLLLKTSREVQEEMIQLKEQSVATAKVFLNLLLRRSGLGLQIWRVMVTAKGRVKTVESCLFGPYDARYCCTFGFKPKTQEPPLSGSMSQGFCGLEGAGTVG